MLHEEGRRPCVAADIGRRQRVLQARGPLPRHGEPPPPPPPPRGTVIDALAGDGPTMLERVLQTESIWRRAEGENAAYTSQSMPPPPPPRPAASAASTMPHVSDDEQLSPQSVTPHASAPAADSDDDSYPPYYPRATSSSTSHPQRRAAPTPPWQPRLADLPASEPAAWGLAPWTTADPPTAAAVVRGATTLASATRDRTFLTSYQGAVAQYGAVHNNPPAMAPSPQHRPSSAASVQPPSPPSRPSSSKHRPSSAASLHARPTGQQRRGHSLPCATHDVARRHHLEAARSTRG